MSSNEIVFGDVKYREPKRLRRPDRDPNKGCIAYGVPLGHDLPVFVDHKPADAIERHALSDTSVELGGILLGHECIDDQTGEPFVWVTEALEAKDFENTQASFTYTHDSWEAITREKDEKHPELSIIGWYHTHPGFGIFLSGHDLFIHENFFSQPLQIAYVVDPIRQIRGVFQWRDGRVVGVGGFHLTAPRAERLGLARFVHDLEKLPLAEGAHFGGLTPRLEAQLIAMLNRPHAGASGSASAQAGALFGLIGAILGILGLAGILWLNSMAQAVREQGEALKALETTVAEQPDAMASARRDAKEQALDTLLSEIRVGAMSEPVMAAYQRAVSQRDAAVKERDSLLTDKAGLNELAGRLRGDQEKFQRERDEAVAQVDDLKEQSKKLVEAQRAKIEELNLALTKQARLAEETKSGMLARKYAIAWYTAVTTLGLCVLLMLGWVWAIARASADENVEQKDRSSG